MLKLLWKPTTAWSVVSVLAFALGAFEVGHDYIVPLAGVCALAYIAQPRDAKRSLAAGPDERSNQFWVSAARVGLFTSFWVVFGSLVGFVIHG